MPPPLWAAACSILTRMPEQHAHVHWKTFVALLAGLLAIAAVVYGAYYLRTGVPEERDRTDIPPGFPENAPAPSAEDFTDFQTAFQYLVSYTDSGFRPAALTVLKGETIRIANNSSLSVELRFEGDATMSLSARSYLQYTAEEDTTITDSAGSEMTITIE